MGGTEAIGTNSNRAASGEAMVNSKTRRSGGQQAGSKSEARRPAGTRRRQESGGAADQAAPTSLWRSRQ